jgi:hypothetical protein
MSFVTVGGIVSSDALSSFEVSRSRLCNDAPTPRDPEPIPRIFRILMLLSPLS